VGSVLGEALSMSMSNFAKFGLISFLVYSPIIVWGIWVMQQLSPSMFGLDGAEDLSYYVVGLSLAAFVLQPIATGAIIYGVFRRLKGQSASLGKCLAIGISRVLQLLGMTLMMLLMIVGASLVPFVLIYMMAAAGAGPLAVILVIPALVPALMIVCATYAAAPAIVVEKVGPVEAIKRSFTLTRGNRWRIFGIVLVIGIAQKIIDWIVERVFLDAGSVASLGDMDDFVTNIKIYIVVILIVAIIFEVVTAVASALVYYRLKVTAEGADQSELASVFD
jgi:hypothetical protein